LSIEAGSGESGVASSAAAAAATRCAFRRFASRAASGSRGRFGECARDGGGGGGGCSGGTVRDSVNFERTVSSGSLCNVDLAKICPIFVFSGTRAHVDG
jgi:hypothetical protein